MSALFGERLRGYRKLRALSQAELAERLGVALNMISKLEHGVRKVTFDEAIQLADALEVSLDALAGRGAEEHMRLQLAENEYYQLFKELCQRIAFPQDKQNADGDTAHQSSSSQNQSYLYQEHHTFDDYACAV